MNVHYSSNTNEWETPDLFYKELDEEFHFTLDPCANNDNAKCSKYFTKEQNGLDQSWQGNTVFMNPPYGREIGKWVKKAWEESQKGSTIVLLIPSRTDTHYWHDYCLKGEVRFIRGRLYFKSGGKTGRAPFPSAIVIFRGKNESIPRSKF